MTADASSSLAIEAADSLQSHLEQSQPSASFTASDHAHRSLKSHHHHDDDDTPSNEQLEQAQEAKFWQHVHEKEDDAARVRKRKHRKRAKRMHKLYADPGIAQETAHGLMIDAGSTGSRLHLYEWEPRVLSSPQQVAQAVSGNKLTVPSSKSRWTDRLRPGLASFAEIQDDDQLREAVAEYLQPLLSFAKTILHTKQAQFGDYPIFLRATAGMRMLDDGDRTRVMNTVRDLFANKTYCPFKFEAEQARVMSGEEEAVFDWVGVNFLLGDLIDDSYGSGAVSEPRLTHGALDLGGASTQIGFYEPHESIMAGLFKLQIGQAKHFNLYSHSFLGYGMNAATDRFYARLAAGKTTEERLLDGIHNPCMPPGFETQVRSNIQLNQQGVETWDNNPDGFYHATLRNEKHRGNATECLEQVKGLLHLEKNDWCDFAHKGDCSFAGIYQPQLPSHDQRPSTFGEFVAFSNYYHIWQFLQLPERATIGELHNATRTVCSFTHDELVDFNKQGGKVDDAELPTFCFRAAYAFQLLHNGYGFRMEDSIRVAGVINGQKVGWALGSMLYELNAMPWKYVQQRKESPFRVAGDGMHGAPMTYGLVGVVLLMALSLAAVFLKHTRRLRGYKEVSDAENQPLVQKGTQSYSV